MARLKSKQFKKKYASTMDNIPQQGVWSGRGIAIPAAGAIGGGDDYKQKIGRGKLPDFQTGRPTQGADSTFSSYLARVNKGYDGDYLDNLMFPEQEEEDEDIYAYDDPSPVRSRMLPKDFKIMRPRMRGIKEMMKFDDNTMVAHTRYSVVDVFENHHLYDINEELSTWKPFEFGVRSVGLIGKGIAHSVRAIASTGGKLAKAASMAIPGVDLAIVSILAPLKMYRLKGYFDELSGMLGVTSGELASAIGGRSGTEIESVIEKINSMPEDERLEARKRFEWSIGVLKSVLIDLIMSIDSIIGLIGLAGGPVAPATLTGAEIALNAATAVGGFFADVIPWEKWLMRIDASISSSLFSMFEFLTSEKAGDNVNSLILELGRQGGPLAISVFADPVTSFMRLKLLYMALSGFRSDEVEAATEAAEEATEDAADGEVVEDEAVINTGDSNAEEANQTSSISKAMKADVDLLKHQFGFGSGDENIQLEKYIIKEGELMRKDSKRMSIDQLREFIRESIYPDHESYHPPQPLGYEYRAVPTVVPKDEADSEFSTLDNYDDFAVAYKTDGGIISYQDRNKIVKEQALRRLIRKGVRSIIEENKKKRTSSRHRR